MTHDSIGLGEDGPTHQPVEHLAACGSFPTSMSSAPATRSKPPNAGNWRLKLEKRPSMLALTRQKLKPARLDLFAEENLCALRRL